MPGRVSARVRSTGEAELGEDSLLFSLAIVIHEEDFFSGFRGLRVTWFRQPGHRGNGIMRSELTERYTPFGRSSWSKCRTTLVVFFFVLSALFLVGSTASAQYVPEYIGCVGYDWTYAKGVNDLCQIAGFRFNTANPNEVEAIVYDNETKDWTLLPDSGLWGYAEAINNDGEVIGNCRASLGSAPRGAYWPASHDRMVVLESVSGVLGSAAYGANDLQKAVGYSDVSGGTVAVQWDLDPFATTISPSVLGSVPGMIVTHAVDINNNHQVVGNAWNSYPARSVAFYCPEPGDPFQLLPHLSSGGVDGPDTRAHAISDSGLIVGYSRDANDLAHAVAWHPSDYSDIIDLGVFVGIPSTAYDVSTDQQIVGLDTGTGKGFVYDFSSSTCEYLAHLPGDTSCAAFGISDCDYIVGVSGPPAGSYSAVLWTPDAPPVAAFTAAISGFNVTLNASASYDAEGEITDYSWDFGDNTYGSGMIVTHTYADIGPYSITLTVTDGAGQSDSQSQTVGFDKTPESEILELIELIDQTSFEQDVKDRLTDKARKALDLIEIRKKGSDDGPVNILLSLENLVSNFVLVGKIADEYEASDVIAKTNIVISLLGESHMISGVPVYTWYHGCGPTAAGMVLGYWDAIGFGDLVKGPQGNETFQSDEVNATIASQGHIDDYVYPLDGWVNGEWLGILPDNSSIPNSDPHPDDCVADFMHTSRSADGLVWGQSYANMVDEALVEYTTWASDGDYVASVESLQMGSLTWEILQYEVNAARPMIFVIDWNGDAETDHLVTVFGYCEVGNAQLYAFYSTWDNYVYWALFDVMHEGNFYGVSSGITLSISLAS